MNHDGTCVNCIVCEKLARSSAIRSHFDEFDISVLWPLPQAGLLILFIVYWVNSSKLSNRSTNNNKNIHSNIPFSCNKFILWWNKTKLFHLHCWLDYFWISMSLCDGFGVKIDIIVVSVACVASSISAFWQGHPRAHNSKLKCSVSAFQDLSHGMPRNWE